MVAPHSLQKLLSAGFDVLHAGHVVVGSVASRRDVSCAAVPNAVVAGEDAPEGGAATAGWSGRCGRCSKVTDAKPAR